MDMPQDAILLRIFTSTADRAGSLPLYRAIILKAREMNIAGATVLKGPVGFGHSARLQESRLLLLKQDTPAVVEIVDSAEKIDAFLPTLGAMMTGGLVTMEAAKVLKYGKRSTGLQQRIKTRLEQHDDTA